MPAGYSKEMRRWFGDAATVDISMRAAKRRWFARHVTIPRPILSYWVKTGNRRWEKQYFISIEPCV
jgi:hypothetical protein